MREESEETNSSIQMPLRSKASTGNSAGSYCASCGSVCVAGDFASPSLQKRPTFLSQLSSERSLSSTPLRVHRVSTRENVAIPAEDTDSPAVKYLRRLSYPGGKPDTSDSNSFRRLSRILTSALGTNRPRLVNTGNKALTNNVDPDPEEAFVSRRSTEGVQVDYYDDDCKEPAEDEASSGINGLEIPATITLRKASAALVSHTVPETSQRPFSRPGNPYRPATSNESKPPFPELVAFRSTLLAGSDTRSTPSETTTDQENTVTTVSSNSQRRADKEKLKALISLDELKPRPRSNTAGTALTMSDVFVAPGTFAVGTKSRNMSVGSGQLSRRLSVVQFRSRNSVHEIIWREDESSSASCSSKNASPHSAEPLSPATSIGNQEAPRSSKMPRVQSFRHNGLPGPALGPSYEIDESMFQWSWGRQSPFEGVQRDDNVSQLLDPHRGPFTSSTYSDTSISDKHSRRSPVARRSHRRSVSGGGSVVSFPPLLERHCTADWQKLPLVNINEPAAGRAQRDPSLSAGQGADIMTEGEQSLGELEQHETRTRRYSSGSYVPARTGESGRVGSSIGCSSRQRIHERG